MAVVARVRCNSVEHFPGSTSAKFSPVVTNDDPHNDEIKKFFAATPAGSIALSTVGEKAPLDVKPGQQFYLYLEPGAEPGGQFWTVKVTGLTLSNWATQVKLSAEPLSTPPYRPCEMEFTINNELAAEQFQMSNVFYATLAPVPSDA